MKTIEKSIELPVPVSRVWRALTDYHEFGTWFRVKLSEPFFAGTRSSGHITYEGYEHLKWEADIKALEPEREFSFTWHPYAVDPEKDYSKETPTLVTFHLAPTADGTRLTVTEAGFEKIPPERRDEAFRMNDEGWGIQMENIREYLEENP
jgi:uncharacterized protein YndB with AHSA1/START domain